MNYSDFQESFHSLILIHLQNTESLLRTVSCNLIEDIFLLAQPLDNKEQNKNSLWIQFLPVD